MMAWWQNCDMPAGAEANAQCGRRLRLRMLIPGR